MSFEVNVEKRLGDRLIKMHFKTGTGLTALVGRSGCGKSSVLNMIAGTLTPDHGTIVVGGKILFDETVRTPPDRRRAGYIFQDHRLFPHRRVRGNLEYGSNLVCPSDRWADFSEIVELLGIGHLLDRWPRTLSGGETQRVAIGRALLSSPKFLLMDEPLASLDHARREDLLSVIERIRDQIQLPILYVSHDRSEVQRLSSYIVEMD